MTRPVPWKHWQIEFHEFLEKGQGGRQHDIFLWSIRLFWRLLKFQAFFWREDKHTIFFQENFFECFLPPSQKKFGGLMNLEEINQIRGPTLMCLVGIRRTWLALRMLLAIQFLPRLILLLIGFLPATLVACDEFAAKPIKEVIEIEELDTFTYLLL